MSESLEFSNGLIGKIDNSTFFVLNNLDIKTYYWKVIPFIDDIPGFESEIWMFNVFPDIIQPKVIPKYPANNETLITTNIELKWTVEYSGSVAKVRYDIYLDNSTNNPSEMKLIKKDHRQLFYKLGDNVNVNDHDTYYWRIVPIIEIDEGIVIGDFRGKYGSTGTNRFFIDSSYRPITQSKFNLTAPITYVKINPGESKIINLIITNDGDIDLTITISYYIEPDNIVSLNLNSSQVNISAGKNFNLEIMISIPKKVNYKIFVITFECRAEQLVDSKKEILTLEVKSTDEEIEDNNALLIFSISIVIICLIFFIIIFKKIRPKGFFKSLQKIQKQNNDLGLQDSDGLARISIPNTSLDVEISTVQIQDQQNTTDLSIESRQEKLQESYESQELQESHESHESQEPYEPLDTHKTPQTPQTPETLEQNDTPEIHESYKPSTADEKLEN